MHVIVMLGHQGSGKGTQAERLSARMGIPAISVGRLFRAEIERDTGLGEEIASYVDKGTLVPTELVDQVMTERLSEDDTANGVILDGFPRTVEQAGALDAIMQKVGRAVTHVINIKISDEEAVKRLSGRRICSNLRNEHSYHVDFNPPKKNPTRCDIDGTPLVQREDDTDEAINKRLDVYHKDTKPLVEYYRKRGLLTDVNGMQPIELVEHDVATVLGLA